MRARTDLWETGASNRLGPPGQLRSLRKSRSEVRLDQTATRLVSGDCHVSYSRRIEKRFLQMAEGRTQSAGSA